MPDLLQPQCTKNSAQLYTDIVVSVHQDHAIKWQWHLAISFQIFKYVGPSLNTFPQYKLPI